MPLSLSVFQDMHWRHFIAAPHRMFFFGGLWALVLSMLWWGAVLWARQNGMALAERDLPPQWMHGWLMVFGAFPFFVFGFLMTVLPRWLGVPPTAPALYRPAALCLLAGYLLTLAGALYSAPLTVAGMALTAAAWATSVLALTRHFYRSPASSKLHPIWAVILLATGCLGAFLAARSVHIADWQTLAVAPAFGIWAFLAPLVFVVAHRVLPFFSASALGEYSLYRPFWSPPAVVLLFWGHAALRLADLADWLFITDVPLLAITAWHLYRWQPWKARGIPLLWTLHAAFAWMPLALALSSVQSLVLLFADAHILGLAPLHTIAVGLITSMAFAMVTRVSLGHSGRRLHMDRLSIGCFIVLQFAVAARICAELDGPFASRTAWLTLSAVCWLCALTPWALRYSLIYWQPRVDGRPG